MKLLLIWLAAVSVLEILLWTPPFWRWRRAVACLLILGLSVISGLLVGSYPAAWTGLMLVMSLYRLTNLLRILEGRLQTEHLYKVTRRTSYWLIAGQLALLGLVLLGNWLALPVSGWLYALAVAQLIAATVLFASTERHLRTTRPPQIQGRLADPKLPSLTVAIPARNETTDLVACLQSLVASDYPKLEILVLDDCSQNKHTPEIIKSFAQSGVRFISGEVPPERWLAKNYAYHQLSEAANGELLLFCGVDTRFQPGSLRAMVEALHHKNKTMLSFIPRNQPPLRWQLEALLIQPARYAWELAMPRRLFRRPPVLSTCWLIRLSTLRAAGGFTSVSRSVSPESHLARYSAAHTDGYSFLQSNRVIGLASHKSLWAQRSTAIRTRYPQLHRRPELAALFMVGEIASLTLPFVLLIGSLAARNWSFLALSAATCALLITFYVRIVTMTYGRFLWRGLWTVPSVALYDTGLLNYSLWQYEFREVIWKGRNVCLPVLNAIPGLPKIATPGSGKRR